MLQKQKTTSVLSHFGLLVDPSMTARERERELDGWRDSGKRIQTNGVDRHGLQTERQADHYTVKVEDKPF